MQWAQVTKEKETDAGKSERKAAFFSKDSQHVVADKIL